MWPDQVSNPGPLTYESGALPTAQRGPANQQKTATVYICMHNTTHTVCVFLPSNCRIAKQAAGEHKQTKDF